MDEDHISIDDLRARARLGVSEGERRRPQDVLIGLTIYRDLGPAGSSDRLEDTLDYRAVAESVARLAEDGVCSLVERLAEVIARHCVLEFGAARVAVRVAKPGAVKAAGRVSVTITRAAEEYGGGPA